MERLRRKEGENCKMDDNILPLNALEKEKRLGAINNSKALLAEAEGFEPPWAFTPKMFSRRNTPSDFRRKYQTLTELKRG